MAASPPDFSIVLPAYNEAPNVAPMLAALHEVLAPLGRFEILYIDDGSNDGTLDALRHAAAADPTVRYVSFTRNCVTARRAIACWPKRLQMPSS